MNTFSRYLTGLQHIGIPTNCMEESVKFYEELGCIREYETEVREKNQRVVFMRMNNLQLEIYEEPLAAGCAGAINHFAFDCTDTDAVYSLALDKGYRILSEGIEELPFWEKGIRFIIIEGPNKERIEFCQIEKE